MSKVQSDDYNYYTIIYESMYVGREDSLRKVEISYLSCSADWDSEESVVSLQSEVTQSCLLYVDLNTIMHTHRVNNMGESVAILQNFI